MTRLALALVIASTLSGCARVMVYMKQTNEPGGPDYGIVKIKANNDVAFDCVSAPAGERAPTCTRVGFEGKK